MAIDFNTFLPAELLHLLAYPLIAIVVAGLAYNYVLWRRTSPPHLFREIAAKVGWGRIFWLFLDELVNRVLLQKDIIVGDRLRRLAHLMIFWGFVGTFASTSLLYLTNPGAKPLPITDPVRIIGNAGGLLLLVGGTIAVVRLAVKHYKAERTFRGIFFLLTLYVVAVTGFTTQTFSEIKYVEATSVSWWVHIVSVTVLLVTASFNHFAHAVTTPSLRYVERLTSALKEKYIAEDLKEKAVLDQIEVRYRQLPKTRA